MKKLLPLYIYCLISSTVSLSLSGQGIVLKQSNESGVYKRGGKISVVAYTGKNRGDSLRIRILKNNYDELLNKIILIEADSIEIFKGSFDDPCSVMVEAGVRDEKAALGFLISPGSLKPGGSCPEDFDKFWETEKADLKALPPDIQTSTVENSRIETGYYCADITINCTGPKPARGYFARPAIAAPKSLPIVILLHAAGVKGSLCRSEPENALRYAMMGALCFDLNAHGMLNGQPDDYYAGLEAGELNLYFFNGLNNRNEFYFRGMYLRLMRTIDFLTKQPEWDRKRILVIGENQGGGQALVAAGLDERVSAVVAIVPGMCDFMGPLGNREGGWPQPFKADLPREEILKTVPYYDAANILRRSKATLFVEIGLIDTICPPASIYAALNQAGGKKIIYAVPYRGHNQPEKAMAKTWKNEVYRPREEFIKNYLQ